MPKKTQKTIKVCVGKVRINQGDKWTKAILMLDGETLYGAASIDFLSYSYRAIWEYKELESEGCFYINV